MLYQEFILPLASKQQGALAQQYTHGPTKALSVTELCNELETKYKQNTEYNQSDVSQQWWTIFILAYS